jgi:hypothetical protein
VRSTRCWFLIIAALPLWQRSDRRSRVFREFPSGKGGVKMTSIPGKGQSGFGTGSDPDPFPECQPARGLTGNAGRKAVLRGCAGASAADRNNARNNWNDNNGFRVVVVHIFP